jgi:hypothetical protein
MNGHSHASGPLKCQPPKRLERALPANGRAKPDPFRTPAGKADLVRGGEPIKRNDLKAALSGAE